jgi:hypothetical protein
MYQNFSDASSDCSDCSVHGLLGYESQASSIRNLPSADSPAEDQGQDNGAKLPLASLSPPVVSDEDGTEFLERPTWYRGI